MIGRLGSVTRVRGGRPQEQTGEFGRCVIQRRPWADFHGSQTQSSASKPRYACPARAFALNKVVRRLLWLWPVRHSLSPIKAYVATAFCQTPLLPPLFTVRSHELDNASPPSHRPSLFQMAQPQPISQAHLNSINPNVPQPQASPVLPAPYDPVEDRVWENEMLTTKYLATVGPPLPMSDATRALLHTRVLMFKVRIAELTRLRQRLQRPSEEISRELAGHLWKHRFLTRCLFRICELPDEVLGMVFSYVVYSSPITTMKQYHATRNVLTSTCRRFRSVALEHRTLWSTVFFTDHAPWDLSFRALSQAATAPLTVGFGLNPTLPMHRGCNPIKASEIDAILTGLTPSLPHIRTVSAILGDEGMAKFCRWLTPTRPNRPPHGALQTLCLHYAPEEGASGQGTHGPSTVLFDINQLTVPPNLSTIVLDGVRINWDEQNPYVFENVRDLCLSSGSRPMPNIPSDIWSDMLSGAAGTLVRLILRKIWVIVEDEDAEDYLHPTRVLLPKLLDLTISYDLSGLLAAEYTLIHMITPNLTCLTIETAGQQKAYLEGLLLDTVGKFPELRVLHLRFLFFDGRRRPEPVRNEYFLQFGKWLRAMPRLKVLKLGWTYNVVQACLRPLAMPELYLDPQELEVLRSAAEKELVVPSPVCCPELDSVSVSWNDGDPTLDFDDFKLLLEARKQLGKPYCHLEVYAGGQHVPTKLLGELNKRDISQFVGRLELVPYLTLLKAEREARLECGLGFSLNM